MLIAALLSASPAAPAKLVTGLVAPTLTPFHANGTVDLAGVDRQAKFLQATNVSWIFCSGTTGESVDLTVAERKLIAERWMALSKKSNAFRVIVHVGAESIVDTKEMAAHAESLGAHAIAAMPPTFIKPTSLDALVATYAAIGSSAPKTPLFYYHIPTKTGVDFLMADFLAAAGPKIPTLTGIKFTDVNLQDLNEALHVDGGRFNILYGRDQQLLSAAILGVDGAVGSTYNFLGETMGLVLAPFAAGGSGDVSAAALELARTVQLSNARLISIVVDWTNGVGAGANWIKETENLVAVATGPPRLPYLEATPAARAALASALKGWCAELNGAARPSWCAKL